MSADTLEFNVSILNPCESIYLGLSMDGNGDGFSYSVALGEELTMTMTFDYADGGNCDDRILEVVKGSD